jgi:hypothetical protein
MDSKYTPEQALAEATSPIRKADEDIAKLKIQKLQRDFPQEVEKQREKNKLFGHMTQCVVDEACKKLTPEEKQRKWEKAIEKAKVENTLVDRKIQRMLDEAYRRTSVMIMLRDDCTELEDDINEFLSLMEGDPDAGFRFIDIKFCSQNEAMMIYSSIVKPKETAKEEP